MDQARQAAKPDDPRVKAALAEYMERVDRGEQVDREQFLASHADIADELGSFIATSEELARLASPGRKDAEAQSISTRSIAKRDQETLIPERVKGAPRDSQATGLPEQFGRYKILKPLGSGAMGTVYLAEDSQLHRKVALKTPSFEQDETGELLERFYREARSAATIRHPHICPVFDVGEIGGKHFITMAYIEGRPLSAYIRPDKLQPERQTLVAVRKLALALQEAHDHNIIHRDLKPGNIMIDGKGEPIVMDFGLARKVHREDASRLTQSGMIVGSPAYMSPEQVEGDPDKLGPAADQYSLGVILYELLTGQLPFRGSVTGVIGAILTKEPTPVSELRKGIDPRIAALCQRMMAKQARDRYPSMRAVAEAIAGILKEAPGEAMKETVRTVERPAKPQAGAKVEKGAEAAAAVSITASNVTSLFEAAQKCLRKHDYEQVVQMLQQIPEQKRTDEVRALLAKARQLADEVAFLLAEIDEAERVNDNAVLTRATDELLKLKPKHHKALQIKDELSRYGKGKLWKPGGYTPDGRRIGEGSWIPWLGIAVGVIAFAAALWAVTIYLKAGDAVVRVQINNPDVKVEFQNRTLNIQSANKEFKVEPGENTLKITYGGSEFETQEFTLKDGENPAVVVELLDQTLAAKFGEDSIGQWDVKPLPGPPDDGKRPQTVDDDGEWIDLIAGYDVASISTDNQTWRDENGRLVGRMSEELEEGWVVYRSSSDIVGDYDLEIDFRGVDCSPVSIGLPLNDTSVNLSLGQWQWGLHWVDGRNSDQSVPPHKNPDLKYTPGEFTRVQASVRHTGPDVQIETTVNGVSGGSFSGARSRLSIPSEFSPTPRRVKISSQFRSPGKDGRIEIHRARIRMVKGRPETAIPPATSPVPPDAVAFQGHSYKYFGEKLTWKEAKQRCEQMGGHLPIVETAAENAFLNDQADKGFPSAGRNGFESVWLGATDEVKEGEWRWIDGSRVAYTNWQRNQPNNKQNQEHYALLWLSRDPNRVSGQWSDQPNNSVQHIAHLICEWDSAPSDPPVASTSPVPPDAIAFEGHSYKFFPEQLSWKMAKARCEALGGRMVVIDSAAENEFVAGVVAAGGKFDAWVGATDEAREGTWLTVDGRPLTYANWCVSQSQPNNKPPGEHFAVMSNKTFPSGVRLNWQWSDQPNESKQHEPGYVCEWDELPNAPAPAAQAVWTDLFNGSDLAGWHTVGDGGWNVQGGVLTGAPGDGWIATDRDFTDFELELDFRLSARANSGVFLRIPDQGALSGGDFMEIQLIDEAIQANVETWQRTGAIYAVQGPTPAPNPAVGQWHQLTIRADGPEITVSIDGAEVNRVNVDTAPLLGPAKRDLRRPSGHIGFQHRGQPVEFRNIRIRELTASASSTSTAPSGNDWIDMFNGRDLTGWRGLPGQWRWEQGEVVGVTTGAADFNTVLCSDRTYRDFEAEFDIRLDGDTGNSGLQIRSQITDTRNLIATGPQVDVGGEFWGSLYGELSGGMMQQSDQAAVQRALRPGEYNRVAVHCVGKHVRITLNGEQVVDGDFGAMPGEGILGWQLHRGKPMTVRVRNARIRELNGAGAANAPAAAQPLPHNEWITLDPSAPGATSWNWGKPLKNPENKKWENGVLSLDNAAVAFNQVQAKDVSFRAKVRFLEGNNMALVVRGEHGKGGVYALFDKQNNGQMYVAFLNTNKSKVLALNDDYFDFQVDAIGDQVSIQVNGQTVVRHRETQKLKAGHIEVTAYNARGMFKEMAVKVLDEAPAAAAAATENDWTDLFNGRDLTGWQPMETLGAGSDQHRPTTGGWEARSGELLYTTDQPGWLKSAAQYGDFEFETGFKLPAGGNSDIYVRSPGSGRLSRSGMAIQIIDEHSGKFTMDPTNRPGAIWGVVGHDIAPVTRPLGEWNSLSIRCEGVRVQVSINGQQTVDANMQAVAELRDRPRSGYIGLANWGGEAKGIAFRNMRIRTLP